MIDILIGGLAVVLLVPNAIVVAAAIVSAAE